MSWIIFGLSLRFVSDYLGPNWYNLYLDLVILILSIGLFWKKTVWMLAVSSTTVIFLFLLDRQFPAYDYAFVKPMYLILLAVIHALFMKDNGSDTGLEVLKK